MTSLLLLAIGFVAVGFSACALRLVWRLQSVMNELVDRLEELQSRLAATEDQALRSALSAEVAVSVLVGKGVADEDELEEVRRQFQAQSGGADYLPERDGERH
jgi:hypothetical protein